MRQLQKKDILDMIDTLNQAHEEVKRYIDSEQYTDAQDMLVQCQECAISMGTAIEKAEGNDCAAIPHIEEYCDCLYRIHEEISANDGINANRACKALRKQLIKIENSVKQDVPVRKEIAFFPYKASMWDALESVYLAAKNDAGCDAYCVPIPYYNKNPDGSFGEMHYEGMEYPKNIDVVNWEAYDFEKRNPDVIYIHNAYDDWNLVTCVHPRFFSKNLKAHTDRLIYIPYFVLDEIEPDDQGAIDGMKHFCFLPGIINADEVVVQSEKMKQIYVNEYLKAAKAHGLSGGHTDRKRLEEKFKGLGSPKLEKIKNARKEDLEIPDEWLRVIEKPDGSRKKIVFYNTGIAALLENNEKMIEKMRHVFGVFKEHSGDIALLWRPHPLIQSTISSMRPQLWSMYAELAERYKEEGWGIYDDTADVGRAVMLSDIYYGDGSSIVQMYRQTGKPVITQNHYEDKKAYFYDLCAYDGELWFPDYYTGVICEYGNGTIKYRNDIYYRYSSKSNLYDGIFRNRDWMVLLKGNEKEITFIDLNDKAYVKADMKPWLQEKVFCQNDSIIEHGENIFIFLDAELIIKFNQNDRGIERISYPGDICRRGQIQKNGRQILIPSRDRNFIYEFDIETETFTKTVLDSRVHGIGTLSVAGDNCWITNKDDRIILWNKTDGQCLFLEYPCDMQQTLYKGMGQKFLRSYYFKDTVWLIPQYSPEILCIDVDSKTVSVFSMDGEDENEETFSMKGRKNLTKYVAACADGEKLHILSSKTKKMYRISMAAKEADEIECVTDEADKIARLLKFM